MPGGPANTTSFNHTGLANGTHYYYQVKATNLFGSSAYTNVADAVPLVTGLLKPASSAGFVLSPNPAEQHTWLTVENEYRGSLSIQVVDRLGRLVTTVIGQKNQHRWQTEVGLGNLPAGLYVVRVETAEGSRTQRFIKY